MPGLTYKRALILACAVLTVYILLRSTSTSEAPIPVSRNSPPPVGSYDEIRRVVDWYEPGKTVPDTAVHTGVAKVERTKAKQLKPQRPTEDLRGHPLRKQLANLYPYEITNKFPAYIWQTWKVSPSDGKFPEEYRPLEASWSVLHPTFVHEVITDDVASYLVRHLFASIPEIYEAYMLLPTAVLKADLFRYLILLARGGIYTDIDTLALKSAVDWVPENVPRTNYGLIIGIEADPDRPDWKEWYARRIQFCQWTIQSKPGHPVLVDVVSSIVEETLQRHKEGTLKKITAEEVIEFTGPALWTDAVFRYFNDPNYFDMESSKANITWETFTGIEQSKKLGDVIVLPITSFSAGVGQMGAKDENDPMAFVKHNFEGTWKPEKDRHIHGEDPKGQWDDPKAKLEEIKKEREDKKKEDAKKEATEEKAKKDDFEPQEDAKRSTEDDEEKTEKKDSPGSKTRDADTKADKPAAKSEDVNSDENSADSKKEDKPEKKPAAKQEEPAGKAEDVEDEV